MGDIEAFEDLKQELTADKGLAYFDPKRKTTIVTDAGTNGISAILLQNVSNMDKKVIAYSSRGNALQPIRKVSTGYSAWMRKLSVYLIGSTFEMYTEHLPLVTLVNKPNKKIPLHLERLALHLQEHNFTVKHIKGTLNPARLLFRQYTIER